MTADHKTGTMKKAIFFLLLSLGVYSFPATAQDKTQKEAESFYRKAINLIAPDYVEWVKKSATETISQDLGTTDVMERAYQHGKKNNLGELEIQALGFLVMMEANQFAQDDLLSLLENADLSLDKKLKIGNALEVLASGSSLTREQYVAFSALPAEGAAKTHKTANPHQPVSSREKEELEKELRVALNLLKEKENADKNRAEILLARMKKTENYQAALIPRFRHMQQVILQNLK